MIYTAFVKLDFLFGHYHRACNRIVASLFFGILVFAVGCDKSAQPQLAELPPWPDVPTNQTKPRLVFRNVAPEPVVSSGSDNDNSLILGLPAKEYVHTECLFFLETLGKDDYLMQKITEACITNGINIGYNWIIRRELKDITAFKASLERRNASSLEKERVLMMMKFMAVSDMTEGARWRLPLIPKEKIPLLNQLLELPLGRVTWLWPPGVKRQERATAPESEWINEQTVLKYIHEHPAPAPAVNKAPSTK